MYIIKNEEKSGNLVDIIMSFESKRNEIFEKSEDVFLVSVLGINELDLPIKPKPFYIKSNVYSQHYDTHSDNDGWGSHWDVYSDGK